MMRAGLLDGLWDVLEDFMWWVLNTVSSVFYTVITFFMDLLPTEFAEAIYEKWELVSSMYEFANYWAPLTEMLAMVAAYFVFLGVFIAVKLVVKLIPTIG